MAVPKKSKALKIETTKAIKPIYFEQAVKLIAEAEKPQLFFILGENQNLQQKIKQKIQHKDWKGSRPICLHGNQIFSKTFEEYLYHQELFNPMSVYVLDFGDSKKKPSTFLKNCSSPPKNIVFVFLNNKTITKELNQFTQGTWILCEKLDWKENKTFVDFLVREKNLTFTNDALLKLSESFRAHLDLLENELEKIKLVKADNQKPISIQELNEIVSFPETGNVFQISNAFFTNDRQLLLNILKVSMDDTKEALSLNFFLAKHLRILKHILALNTCPTNVPFFLKEKYMNHARRFAQGNIPKLFELLHQNDVIAKTKKDKIFLMRENFLEIFQMLLK